MRKIKQQNTWVVMWVTGEWRQFHHALGAT